MSDYQNQADGFHEEHEHAAKCNHPECSHLEECSHALPPDLNSGRGRPVNIPQNDVWNLTHGRIPFRLAYGFNLLKRSER